MTENYIMNKEKIHFRVALLFIIISVFNSQYSFSQNSGHKIPSTREINSGSVHLVPQEYSTIRSAIFAAQPLDTILVDTGTYLDTTTIVVDKSLVLIGKGSDSTILKLDTQYNFHFTVLEITAANVVVKGISFDYLLYYYPPLIRGIITATTIVQNASNIKFENIKFPGLHPMQIDLGGGFNGGDGVSIINSEKIYFKNVCLQGGNGGDGNGHGPGGSGFYGGNGGNGITINSSTEVEATNCLLIAGLGGNGANSINGPGKNGNPGQTFSVSNYSSIYLVSDSLNGTDYLDSTSTIVNGPTAVTLRESKPPAAFLLNQNYPNPFNPSTVISYQLPTNTLVKLKVYDELGRLVRTLVNENQHAGEHSFTFNASNISSGIYFYRLSAGSFVQTKKLILLK